MLLFRPITEFQPGTLSDLLQRCYQDLFEFKDINQDKMKDDCRRFDQEVFANPDTIEKCVFITTLDDQVI